MPRKKQNDDGEDWTACEYCGCDLKRKNLDDHVARVHPGEWDESGGCLLCQLEVPIELDPEIGDLLEWTEDDEPVWDGVVEFAREEAGTDMPRDEVLEHVTGHYRIGVAGGAR